MFGAIHFLSFPYANAEWFLMFFFELVLAYGTIQT